MALGEKSTKCPLSVLLGQRVGTEDEKAHFQTPVSRHFLADALLPLSAHKHLSPMFW